MDGNQALLLEGSALGATFSPLDPMTHNLVPGSLNNILRFSIDKGDLVLSTSLFGPTGAKLLEHVSEDFESVELSFPTQVAGIYRIKLQLQDGSKTPRLK
jgi:hypothetical protein